MELWNVGVMIVTLVGAGGGAVVVMWRIIRSENGTLRRDFETLREESREAHEKIGGQVSEVRKEISEVRKELGGEIADLREGIAGLQGEMKGMRDFLLTLREDFRAHVLAER